MKVKETDSQGYTVRTAGGEEDFWLVRQFLIDTWQLMPPFYNWEIRRWDGWYWHREQPGWDTRYGGGKCVGLWQASDGQLVGAAHPENGGDVWLEIHLDYRNLIGEMLDWAEANLAKQNKAGRMQLIVPAWDYDAELEELLRARGYTNTQHGEVIREKPYTGNEVPPQMPDGYKLHGVRRGHLEDCERYAALLNAAFRRDFHKAAEIATFTLNSPSFNPELELVAVAPDGGFAALAGMTYDDDNRFGLFEPVCAIPGPRPLGLTGKLMLEGHLRVRALGAEHCYVGTGIGAAANRFYDSVGFKVLHTRWYWKKEL